MNDEAFAALEQRLASAMSVGGRGYVDRDGVLEILDVARALWAELELLRAFTPPALAVLERLSWVFETLDSLRAEAGPDERLGRKLRHHLATARGHLLAALAARPPGAEADHDAGDRQLDKVLQDGAELERLRLPPDVSGLMTAAEVGAVLDRMAYNWPQAGDAPSYREAWQADLRALLDHAEASAALIRELYGVIADLHADDPGRQALLERGRAEGREQAARAVEKALTALLARGRREGGRTDTLLRGVAAKVRALGPCRPPLPPQEAEAEAGRLREALRQCLERLEWVADGHGLSPLHFAHAIDAARAALREAPRR